MKKIQIGLLLFIPFLLFCGIRVYKDVIFTIGCNGHLKRAADANTVNLAKEELSIALKYMEANGMTNGYTSVIYQTPDEDVGFWYRNLSQSLQELSTIKKSASPLEKSNVLMKLRETLLDKDIVTIPDGIGVFPRNLAYAIWGWGSLFLALLGGVLIAIGIDE